MRSKLYVISSSKAVANDVMTGAGFDSTEWSYVHSVQALRGRNDVRLLLVGNWDERRDIVEVGIEVMSRNIRVSTLDPAPLSVVDVSHLSEVEAA